MDATAGLCDVASFLMRFHQMFRENAFRLTTCGLLAAGFGMSADPAFAQGRLMARYEASLAGVVVGKGDWFIEISDDQYTASASGGSTGLLKMVSGGKGATTAQGRMVNGQFAPATYVSTITTEKKSETIKLLLAGGSVKEFGIEPQSPVMPERLPITDAHLRNVIDPMVGSMVRVPGAGDPVSPDACRSSTSVFDGRMRYDLKLDFKRMDQVRAEKGYSGPVVVCAVYFKPISGFVPDRSSIKYLEAQRNIEVWLAPIAGTRVLVPFKLTVPTPFGTAALEATQFMSVATPSKAASKTQ